MDITPDKKKVSVSLIQDTATESLRKAKKANSLVQSMANPKNDSVSSKFFSKEIKEESTSLTNKEKQIMIKTQSKDISNTMVQQKKLNKENKDSSTTNAKESKHQSATRDRNQSVVQKVQEDMIMEKVRQMIRDIKLFEKYVSSNNPSECIMTKCVEEKFRQIYSYGEEGKEKSEQVSKDPSRNKIKKVNLKKYLSEKYTPKVASKICNLFDWNNAMDHSMFFKHINDLFI